MSTQLALHLLGPPRVVLDNAPISINQRKTLALLAYMTLNRSGQPRNFLSALLWPEYEQARALKNLRQALWETRQALGDGWIAAGSETIALTAATTTGQTLWLDVARFETLIAESRTQNDSALRIPLLTEAIQYYRNHFLTGFSLKDAPGFNAWTFGKSEELRQRLAGALGTLAGDHCALGQVESAIPYARRLVTLDALNEAAQRQLMQVYIQAGQHHAALKQYQTCEKLLQRELGIDPQPETRELYKQIRKGGIKPVKSVRQKKAEAPRHNIPLQLSSFIGREKELNEIAALMADRRLVTLTGTGGIGKTRLSLKVGELLAKEYADGVWLVELAALSDPTRVPQAVASLFNLIEGSDEALSEKLVRSLRPKSMLLILDNCEHLLEACAQLADALLKGCPELKILATSREGLNISGEALYRVPSLRLPEVQQFAEKLRGYESIQLFEARARLVQEDFALTMENAASITQICQRLDGIPLAIELAAARVNMLTSQQIAARLNESFALLTGGSRAALPRHQTLRASIDWSWGLLSEAELMLLRRLSIFAGGWTLDAAEAVCARNGIEPGQVLELITQLVTKSLVVIRQEAGREQRYGLLEMVRQYAREKLAQAGEEENIQDQHLSYFLALSEQIEHELVRFRQMEWFARTNDERDNLRAALAYASKNNQVEAGLYIAARLRNFWEYFDNSEGARWLAEFIQQPRSKEYPIARAKALYAQGWFMAMTNQFGAARSAAQECLVLCRAYGDQFCEVDGLYLLGFISDGDQKTDYCQQALALARALGDLVRQASALNFLGWDHRDLERALAYWEEAIPLYRQIGNRRSLANCLSRLGYFLVLDGKLERGEKYLAECKLLFQELNLNAGDDYLNVAYGQIAQMNGDFELARTYFQEDAQGSKEAGRQYNYWWAIFRVGGAEMREGNLSAAREIFSEAVHAFHKDGITVGVVVTVQHMASLFVMVGKDEEAARLIGWANVTRVAIKNTRPALEQADLDHDIAAVVSRIGKRAFEEAYTKGCAMTLDEAVAYALDES